MTAEIVELNFNRNSAAVVRPRGGDDGGGGMDDVLKRLGNVEKDVSDIRAKVSGIEAVIPHLATKADVSNSALKIIGWMIGTAIALTTLAFTIARYVAPA